MAGVGLSTGAFPKPTALLDFDCSAVQTDKTSTLEAEPRTGSSSTRPPLTTLPVAFTGSSWRNIPKRKFPVYDIGSLKLGVHTKH